MKPGDLIEWAYRSNDKIVFPNEELWSTPMQAYVPIGSNMLHLLVSITDEHIYWFNEKGFFHARVNDAHRLRNVLWLEQVVPRARGWCGSARD